MIMTMAMRSVGQLVGRDSDELDEFFLFCLGEEFGSGPTLPT